MNREEWKREHDKGLGGSDAAAILGLSPWASAMDVWIDKTGRARETEPDPEREFLLDLGNIVEPLIARRYERETGRILRKSVPILVHHPLHAQILGSPDRLVIGEKRGVELKTENQFQDNFGDPGSDEVPEWYRVQCAHYLALLDYEAWDIALLHGGTRFAIYPLERDKQAENALLEFELEWWERHVVRDTPPDVDGSHAWARYLAQKFPRHSTTLVVADDKTEKLAAALVRTRVVEDEIAELRAEFENRLKFLIGENEGLRGDFGRVTWKRTKDSIETDWQNALVEVRGTLPFVVSDRELILKIDEMITEIIRTHTKPKPGARRFLLTKAKEKKPHERIESARSDGQLVGS